MTKSSKKFQWIVKLPPFVWMAGVALCELAFLLGLRETVLGLMHPSSIVGLILNLTLLTLCIGARTMFWLGQEAASIEQIRIRSARLRQNFWHAWQSSKEAVHRRPLYMHCREVLASDFLQWEEGQRSAGTFQLACIQLVCFIPLFFFIPMGFIWGVLALGIPVLMLVAWKVKKLRRLQGMYIESKKERNEQIDRWHKRVEWMRGNVLGFTLIAGFENRWEEQEELVAAYTWWSAVFAPLLEFAFFCLLLIMLLAGAWGLMGPLQMDKLTLFVFLLLLAYRPLREVARHFPIWQSGKQAHSRIIKLISKLSSVEENHANQKKDLQSPIHQIEVDQKWYVQHERFAYNLIENKHLWPPFTLHMPTFGSVCMWGQNGTGKTTLLRLLTGMEGMSQFAIQPKKEWLRNGKLLVSYLPQEVVLWPNDWLPDERCTASMAEELWYILGLEQILNEPFKYQQESSGWEKPIHALSTGQRQRLALYQVLIQNKPLLLLDEPSQGIPHAEINGLIQSILEWRKKSVPDGLVMIATHEPLVKELCDCVLMFEANVAPKWEES